MSFTNTLKALNDPVRREILLMLRNGKLSAGEISEKFDVSNATVSYHLKQLKTVGLIEEEKYKNFIYYTLNTSIFEETLLWFKQFEGGPNID